MRFAGRRCRFGRPRSAALAGALLAAWALPAVSQSASTEVTFVAADGVAVFADWYQPPGPSDRDGAIIILFHQAGGDARGEYSLIVPRLLDAGYQVLAVDQRSGGDRFGGVNRTVAELDREYGYCEAYPDLEAALAWAIESLQADRVAVWGSSYSAALVIRLAVNHPESVDAVLAFSPASGEPMEGCRPDEVLRHLTTPAMALRPDREMEIESVAAQALDLERNGVVVVVSEGGVHGSSMLDPVRASGGVEATWQAVLEFLSAHL
jgi:acetyl esterase/lipase